MEGDLFNDYQLPNSFAFEKDFLQRYSTNLMPSVYKTSCYFIDIGTPEDFERAEKELPSLE